MCALLCVLPLRCAALLCSALLCVCCVCCVCCSLCVCCVCCSTVCVLCLLLYCVCAVSAALLCVCCVFQDPTETKHMSSALHEVHPPLSFSLTPAVASVNGGCAGWAGGQGEAGWGRGRVRAHRRSSRLSLTFYSSLVVCMCHNSSVSDERSGRKSEEEGWQSRCARRRRCSSFSRMFACASSSFPCVSGAAAKALPHSVFQE